MAAQLSPRPAIALRSLKRNGMLDHVDGGGSEAGIREVPFPALLKSGMTDDAHVLPRSVFERRPASAERLFVVVKQIAHRYDRYISVLLHAAPELAKRGGFLPVCFGMIMFRELPFASWGACERTQKADGNGAPPLWCMARRR